MWKHLRSGTWLILIITILSSLLHHFGWFRPLETTSLDFFLRVREPVHPKYVWLVAITDQDYADPNLFRKTSPLDPALLGKLIGAITRLRPRVIGVDIDTTDSHGLHPQEGDVPIVWGQRIELGEDAHQRKRLPVLGNAVPQPDEEHIGISALPSDHDGTVRRYRRKIPVADGEADSLPWAVTKAFARAVIADSASKPNEKKQRRNLLQSEEGSDEARVLAFSEQPHSRVRVMSASDVLQLDANAGSANNRIFQNAAVMLGGTFSLSGDFYGTPLGKRAGVDLFCDAIETELQGRPVTPVNEILMILFDVLGGFLLTGWHVFSKAWSSAIMRVLAIPLLALGFSFVAFSSFAYWANFVPVLAGVLIHELYEHFKHHRALVRQVREFGQRDT